jgi:hydroxypyruvate reductase
LTARAFELFAPPDGHLSVVSVGKASAPMARVAEQRLGSRIRRGLVVTAHPADVPTRFESIVGGHPVPTADSERAGRRTLAIGESLTPGETLLVLLSGGASSLMAVPAEGMTLEDKRASTARLLRGGADIRALNSVRKHVSAIKGGWLAARAGGRCLTYAVSDVVGDDVSLVGSGPTVADPSTYAEALAVLGAYGGVDAHPRAIVRHLERGARGTIAETPKPEDGRLARATSHVIGGRREAMDGAAAEARRLGYHVVTLGEPVVGESRVAASEHVHAIQRLVAKLPRPLCVVSGGETTVRVTGSGVGGRNQEFALAAAPLMPMLGAAAVLASVGTDGIDGPTDAAGAIADSTTIDRARAAGLASANSFLDANDSYSWFAAIGDLIHTGPTDTNVGDLQAVLLA